MPNHTPVRRWTQEEDAIVRDTVALSIAEVTERLPGRSRGAVRNRRSTLGVLIRRRRTEHDTQRIREWYAGRKGHDLALRELARELDRSVAWISRVATSLGLSDAKANQRDADGRYPHEQPMFDNPEARRRHQSESMRRHIALNGHPRGMLGKTHRPENIEAMQAGIARYRASLTQEQRSEIGRKAVMTRVERYGTAAPIFPAGSNPYSRTKSGYCDDMPGIFFRSVWEANYARYLSWLVGQGEILSWEYEPDTFVFQGVTRAPISYKPDFRVVERDGSISYHEVKGWMDGKSKSKLKRMAKFYPDVKLVVIDQAQYTAIGRWSSLVPYWGDEPKKREKA